MKVYEIEDFDLLDRFADSALSALSHYVGQGRPDEAIATRCYEIAVVMYLHREALQRRLLVEHTAVIAQAEAQERARETALDDKAAAAAATAEATAAAATAAKQKQ